jgi:hypothetical protein
VPQHSWEIWRNPGIISRNAIAQELNARNIKTARGGDTCAGRRCASAQTSVTLPLAALDG